jgi:hypothetical protein
MLNADDLPGNDSEAFVKMPSLSLPDPERL